MGHRNHTAAKPDRRRRKYRGGTLVTAGAGICFAAGMWTSSLASGPGTLAAAAAPAPADAPGPAAYQQAVDRFNSHDYPGATALLDTIRENGNARDRADILNLRGAIYLKQRHFEKARAFFARARSLDPSLWAASFNEAEANFEEGDYGLAHRQFALLLGNTGRAQRPQEWAVLQYKQLLAALLDGDEKPARDFIAEHQKDAAPPSSYFYLNAAMENRKRNSDGARQWLARADAAGAPAINQILAESFEQLGWDAPHPTQVAVAVATPVSPASPVARGDGEQVASGSGKLGPATLAVVQLMPGGAAPVKPPRDPAPSQPKPAFRFGGPSAVPLPPEPSLPSSPLNNPPGPPDELRFDEGAEGGMLAGAGPEAPPSPLAKHRARATPSPTDSPASDDSSLPAGSPAASASPDASASPSPSPTPAPSPAPAFVQKYEAAYVKFLEKDYAGAKTLLDEADAIQPNQPNSINLRSQIFKHYYEAAYVAYLKSDYPSAVAQLDQADAVQPNQPDASNLRGLVSSRQHNYDQAEAMFKKAIQVDPTFWAAKFNLAELPFNYRNYTAARSRFEDLFSQTDPVKQPREAELTQFKVFLTLLLEGKEAGARAFMEHFTFSGTTPARYFCQSALDFYHGDVDKALSWLDSAKKEYPAQLVSIFIESFYRVGWMTDPNAKTPPSVAAASPGPTAAPGAVVVGSPAPSATPALVVLNATPSPTPITKAATPAPSAVVLATPAPKVSATPAPVVVLATPAPTVAPKASATPAPVVVLATPAASASPALVVLASPAPSLAVNLATPTAAPALTPLPTAAASVAATSAPVASPTASAVAETSASPEASSAPEATVAAEAAPEVPTSTLEEVTRFVVIVIVLFQIIYGWVSFLLTAKRLSRRPPRGGGGPGFADGKPSEAEELEEDEVEAPR